MPERLSRISLRSVALFYLLAILFIPVGLVFFRAFEPGLAAFWTAVSSPDAQHALWLTFICTIVAVPLNTIFGIAAALYVVRGKGPGRKALDAIIDIPFAISPVVVGLALVLVYGENGWFGSSLVSSGFQVIFALPGMILATTFVCLPFVAREVIPTLRELGDEQEQAAQTLGANSWQTFWRITLPSIKWALGYGIVLTTARAIGEFGAVAVVSGHIVGQTDTATLYVANQFENFNLPVAYAVSVVLATAALFVIFSMTLLQRRQERSIKEES
ncbi:MAG: sulfate ABC transporter permease subunit CysW [Thermoleophilaceae bacterium]|nr:sulfate ABC transporter permease subunit CysW [Thermoleophilaceae bacterium]